MFGKFFAHVMRTSWRVPVFMSVVAVLLSILVMLENLLTESVSFRYSAPLVIRALIWIFVFLYLIYMIASSLIVALYMPMRFYRMSYSNAGYLYHSMPVSKSAFLGAHVLSGGLWMILYAVVYVLCMWIVTGRVGLMRSIFDEFSYLLREIQLMSSVARAQMIACGVFLFIAFLLTPFMSMTMTCCAVSLGQGFKKHKVFGAVVWFFILSFLVSLVALTYLVTAMLSADNGLYSYGTNIMIGVYRRLVLIFGLFDLLLILMGILFWWITVRRMKWKLNLE